MQGTTTPLDSLDPSLRFRTDVMRLSLCVTLLVLMSASAMVVGTDRSAAASSGGRNGRIAFASSRGKAGRWEIYTVKPDGTGLERLTSSRSANADPAFSPHGRLIAFDRAIGQTQNSDLWVMHADGTHSHPLSYARNLHEVEPAWSPSSKQIVFAVTSPATKSGLWVMSSNGRQLRRLTVGADTAPAWSPNGQSIAFDRSGDIYIVPAAGGTATNITNDPTAGEFNPDWSPDGTQIVFSSDRGHTGPNDIDRNDLWVMNADGSDAHAILDFPQRSEMSPAWSPDGKRIVYSSVGAISGDASSQIDTVGSTGSGPVRALTHVKGDAEIVDDEPSWQSLRPF